MEFQFQNTAFLLALAAVPLLVLLFWLVIRWKKKTVKSIGDARLVKELIKGYSPGRYFIKFLLVTIALVAVIIGIADPQKHGVMDKVERKGVDVMIALDVSNSMLAEDIKPNRLDKAKQLVIKLLAQLENDRVGLVVFAGRAYMQMPLTLDHGAARMYVQNAGPQMVPTQGTMLSEALKLSATAFNSKERKFKSIILITDGEDHDPVSLQTAEELASNGVMINSVGIGSSLGTPIPNPATGQYRKDEAGNTVLSKLNEPQLQQLARLTKGVYVRPDDGNEAVSAIMKQLSTIQETALEDSAFKDYIHYFYWFIALALILLIAEFLLPERKWEKSAKSAGQFALSIILLIPWSSAVAQDEETLIRNGNKRYNKGQYDKALPLYEKAVEKDATHPVANYNTGNAFFKTKQWEQAEKSFDRVSTPANEPALRQKALYNKGVSLSKQNKLEESIAAYKNAVILNPNDEDARFNLQKALLEQKKRKPPEKENKEEKKNDKQKKDQKPPPQSKLTKKQVEQLLKSLQQREQQAQQKMQQNRSRGAAKPEKDW